MTGSFFHEALNLLDDDLVQAVDALRLRGAQPANKWKKWGALAACLCLVLAGGLVLSLYGGLGGGSTDTADSSGAGDVFEGVTEDSRPGAAGGSDAGAAPGDSQPASPEEGYGITGGANGGTDARDEPLGSDSAAPESDNQEEPPPPEPNPSATGAGGSDGVSGGSEGTLPGAEQVWPAVRVEGKLYRWAGLYGDPEDQALPEGAVYYGELRHVDAGSLTQDGDFEALFTVTGQIYLLPDTDEKVFLLLTTSWLTDAVVVFELAE